ncbi:hypothetical protein ACLB2K_055238 [Fragaria x ananassa]
MSAQPLKCGCPSVHHRMAPARVRLHPSGLQQRPRPLFLPVESAEFQYSDEITQNFKQNRSRRKTGIRRTRRGRKVIGDAAGGRWGGDATSPTLYGGKRRDVRTLMIPILFEDVIEYDRKIGLKLRDSIIPKAVLWFTGEAVETDELDSSDDDSDEEDLRNIFSDDEGDVEYQEDKKRKWQKMRGWTDAEIKAGLALQGMDLN